VKPSLSAIVARLGVSARTASGDISTYDDLRMKVSTESGDENLAAPPVGNT
jgi:predicted DNA-binding transcriptional regulator YafY